MNALYLRFLRLSNVLKASNVAVQNIDPTAMLLLNEIAVQHSEGKTMTVTEAMALNAIASPATLHRKLDDLREAGLIDFIFEGKNRRTKFLVPTRSANTYFENMSKLMRQSLT